MILLIELRWLKDKLGNQSSSVEVTLIHPLRGILCCSGQTTISSILFPFACG